MIFLRPWICFGIVASLTGFAALALAEPLTQPSSAIPSETSADVSVFHGDEVAGFVVYRVQGPVGDGSVLAEWTGLAGRRGIFVTSWANGSWRHHPDVLPAFSAGKYLGGGGNVRAGAAGMDVAAPAGEGPDGISVLGGVRYRDVGDALLFVGYSAPMGDVRIRVYTGPSQEAVVVAHGSAEMFTREDIAGPAYAMLRSPQFLVPAGGGRLAGQLDLGPAARWHPAACRARLGPS